MEEIRRYEELEKEYEMLREEIRGNAADLLKISTFTIPIAITIISYAWTSEQGALALMNILLTYSMVSKQMKYRQSTFKNATYCEVFLEPYLHRKWETRLHGIEKLQKNEKKENKKQEYLNRTRFLEWIAIEIASFITFGIRGNDTAILDERNRFIVATIAGIIVVVHTICFIRRMSDIHGGKESHYHYWETLKSQEDAKKKGSI